MNANELANKSFMELWDSYTSKKMECEDLHEMLSQQQAEIEALKQIIDANNLNQNIGQFVKPTNEPVAWMQTFTQVKDGVELVKHAVNIEQVGINDIPLYTHPADTISYKDLHQMVKNVLAHPVKELNDGGEPVKNATYWKRQYNLMATQNDNLKSGLYHANEQIKYLESHPVEEQDESFDRTASHMAGEYVSYKAELTDEEIIQINKDEGTCWDVPDRFAIQIARAILRKAQE